MGTAATKRTARLRKIETLPDEERVFIARLISAGKPSWFVAKEYEGKFGKTLGERTVRRYVAQCWLPEKAAARQAAADAAEFVRIKAENPEMPEDVLLRGFLRRRQASPAFQEATVDPKLIIGAELDMRKLDLEERRVVAIERHNQLEEQRQALKSRELEIARNKIAAAAGGMDARELYLRAAQDVLKKLHTYKDLKPALDTKQDEIVSELAHSAEGFARKLEQAT